MQINNVVVVCSGENYNLSKLQNYCQTADLIIACDGGFDILQQISVEPNIILGDFDSSHLTDKIKSSNAEILQYNCDKDDTDSELGIKKALTYSPKNIYLFASTGSYLDHSIVNVLQCLKYGSFIHLVTTNSIATFYDKSFTISNKKSCRFGLFPIGQVKNINLKGCKYFYKKTDLQLFDYSVSNEIISDILDISFDDGGLLFILYDKTY